MNEITENLICILCQRKVPELTDHHIIPRVFGGKELLKICLDCHRQLHVLFNNKMLAEELYSIDKILANEAFSKYVSWVEKRPYGVIHKVKHSKNTRKRGRKG